MEKRVWGYNLCVEKVYAMKKDIKLMSVDILKFKRYTPLEIEVNGKKIWYARENENDPESYFHVVMAECGMELKIVKKKTVKEILEEIPNRIKELNRIMENETSKVIYAEICNRLAALMKYVSQFDEPDKHSEKEPPESLPFYADYNEWCLRNCQTEVIDVHSTD